MTPASSVIGQTLLEGAHEQPIGMTSCSLRLAGGTLQKQEKKKRQAVLSLADGRNSFGVDWLIHKDCGGMSEFRSAVGMLADVIEDLILLRFTKKN